MSTSRRRLILIGIPLVTGILSVPVAELVFRAAGVRIPMTTDGIYRELPDGGYGHRPSLTTYCNWYPRGFTVRTDELGLRVPADGDGSLGTGDAVDVVVLGDSQGFGNGVEAEESIPGRLAALGTGAQLRFANASVGGHFLRNQTQVLELLRDQHQLRCRAVLVLLTPRMISEPETFSRTAVRDGNLFDGTPGALALIRQWLSTHSAAYTVVRDAARRLTTSEGQSTGYLLQMFQNGVVREERESGMSKALGRVASLARSMGGGLAVAYLPLDIEPSIARLARAAGQDAVVPGAPAKTAAAAAAAVGAQYLDARAAVDALRASGGKVSLDGDPHYNATASDRCARAILNGIDWGRVLGAKFDERTGGR